MPDVDQFEADDVVTKGELSARSDVAPQPTSLSSRFAKIWLLALENRVRILRVAIITAVLASIVVFLIPNEFESTARLLPPSSMTSMMLAGAAARFGLSAELGGGLAESALGALKGGNSTLVPILESRTVQDAIIDHFDLRRVYRTRYYKNARKSLGQHSSIGQDRQTGVITISVRDREASRAAAIARMYIDELNRVAAQMDTSDAHKERVFIEGQLKAAEGALNQASADLGEFSSTSLALDVKEQGKALVEGVAGLEGQLIAAQSELRGLQQIYGDQNSRVRASQARVGVLQAKVNEFQAKDNKEPFPGLRQLPELGVHYAELYRRVKVQEAVFELLSQEYEVAKIEEAKQMPTIRVLDPPDVPEKKSFPPRTILVLCSALLSVVLTILYLHLANVWMALPDSHPSKTLLRNTRATLARPATKHSL